MKQKNSIQTEKTNDLNNSVKYRPIAENSNDRFVDVWELNEEGTGLEIKNSVDSQAEINRYAKNLDVESIIQRFIQSDSPVELNTRNGEALNREVEVDELQTDGSIVKKRINYADASWYSPSDTYVSISEKLKKAQTTINQLNEEFAKVKIKEQKDDNSKVAPSMSFESSSAQEQSSE